jgi:hypothetical protein
MMKQIGTFALLIFAFSAFGQADPAPAEQATPPAKRYSRPDIPGIFTVEIGVNGSFDFPNKFDVGFWGSRTINLYYQYEMRLGKSKVSFVPGIGFSLERFKFVNSYTLGYDSDDSLKYIAPGNTGLSGIKKSQLITNYIEVPVELRYSSRPEDPSRSFKVSLGYRVGYLYEAYTKLKYTDNAETKKIKNIQAFHLNRFRPGPYIKIGVASVSLFGYYNLSSLFEPGRGPYDDQQKFQGKLIPQQDFSTFTTGISFASF